MTFLETRVLAAGLALAAAAGPGAARELGGHSIPEEVRLEPEGALLKLNGAYVRTSFLREVTLFALYSAEPVASFETLIQARGPVRVAVTILRPEFTAKRFRDGWREQFGAVLTPDLQQSLAPQIAEFIDSFETMRRGEQLHFDFMPAEGVRFWIRGERKRTIHGKAFAAELLGVWMGPRSVDPGLRNALLGAGAR